MSSSGRKSYPSPVTVRIAELAGPAMTPADRIDTPPTINTYRLNVFSD